MDDVMHINLKELDSQKFTLESGEKFVCNEFMNSCNLPMTDSSTYISSNMISGTSHSPKSSVYIIDLRSMTSLTLRSSHKPTQTYIHIFLVPQAVISTHQGQQHLEQETKQSTFVHSSTMLHASSYILHTLISSD